MIIFLYNKKNKINYMNINIYMKLFIKTTNVINILKNIRY